METKYFFRTPDIDSTWDIETGELGGKRANYFTCGAAVTEVEIDCLTGDHTILRTDIVMDLGRSLNPAIDIGQVRIFSYFYFNHYAIYVEGL